MLNQSDVEHLLRRTEFVARPARVAALAQMNSIAQAVDDVLATGLNSWSSPPLTASDEWGRSDDYVFFWFDRMAHDSARPIQDKMAVFWHGHYCSAFDKVGSAAVMAEQIDGFRSWGLGDLAGLTKRMSTQVAMLRYLDNNQNKHSSPNQNFARELMELFLLGVGNYTEADVEASTAAWTGHTDDWDTHSYRWRPDWHDSSPKHFLGQTINTVSAPNLHGYDTIDVTLGPGIVPAGATRNVGRPTPHVVAEFLSTKLWTFFAGTPIPDTVMSIMRSTALSTGFRVEPWVRSMLVHPEFYTAGVKQGLVRSPIDLMVAYMFATGLRARGNLPIWLMQGMGQRPLLPPDVSGWKHNAYFVNPSAIAERIKAARHFAWRTMAAYDGVIRLAGGTISQAEVEATSVGTAAQQIAKGRALLDRILSLMYLNPTPTARNALYDYASGPNYWERYDLVSLALMMPDMHVA